MTAPRARGPRSPNRTSADPWPSIQDILDTETPQHSFSVYELRPGLTIETHVQLEYNDFEW